MIVTQGLMDLFVFVIETEEYKELTNTESHAVPCNDDGRLPVSHPYIFIKTTSVVVRKLVLNEYLDRKVILIFHILLTGGINLLRSNKDRDSIFEKTMNRSYKLITCLFGSRGSGY